MMEIKNLHKYYNKNKPNELHVLNGISVKFDKCGLVALYGKSGSGKTTLLNCLGGIDDFDSGEYRIGTDTIDGNNLKKLTAYKRKNIGFVFQDYNLIENVSVEENILTALDIAGLNRNIEKANIVLSAVGMARYNKRKVFTLSGGQKQRIAIARALVINPKVILADEPTGNLDKVNSLNILTILKGISAEILVVLVSHEKDLVNQFADRIIEIDNNKIISDRANNQARRILQDDRRGDDIYLSELALAKLNVGGNRIKIYSDKQLKVSDLNIVICDGKITVFSESDDKIETGRANINTGVKPKETQTEDLMSAGNTEVLYVKEKLDRAKSGTVRTHKKRLIKEFFLMNRLKAVAAVVIAISAILVAISMSFLGDAGRVNAAEFQATDKRVISLFVNADGNTAKLRGIESVDNVAAILPYFHPMNLKYTQRRFIQANIKNAEVINFYLKPLPLSLISASDIIEGRMPQNNFEVVLDKFYADKLFVDLNSTLGQSAVFGIVNYSGFLGGELPCFDNQKVTVVGISDTASPVVYMGLDLLYSMFLKNEGLLAEQLFTENLKDFTDTDIVFIQENGIYVSEEEFITSGYSVGDNITIGRNTRVEKTYKIEGYFETKEQSETPSYIISSNELKNIIFKTLANNNYVEIVVKNKETATRYFNNIGMYANDVYQSELEAYLRESKSRMILQFVFTIVIVIVAAVIYYFVVKASVLERKKELAIKVVLGMNKRKLYAEFIFNSILFFMICALPIYLITNAVLHGILSNMLGLLSVMSFSFENFIIGLIVLLAMPFIATILPLLKYLRKKPIELLRE
jgi:ABC-type lipoprotein export system ATPase subunit/ABC-type antimicrobial peptide transport system permease subunit